VRVTVVTGSACTGAAVGTLVGVLGGGTSGSEKLRKSSKQK